MHNACIISENFFCQAIYYIHLNCLNLWLFYFHIGIVEIHLFPRKGVHFYRFLPHRDLEGNQSPALLDHVWCRVLNVQKGTFQVASQDVPQRIPGSPT